MRLSKAPTAIVAQVEDAAKRRYQELDAQVDRAEGEGLAARWAFGREMEREAKNGRMPHGRLDELVEATEKSRAELQQRHRFYTENPELPKALGSYRSWNEFVNAKKEDGHGGSSPYDSADDPKALIAALEQGEHALLRLSQRRGTLVGEAARKAWGFWYSHGDLLREVTPADDVPADKEEAIAWLRAHAV